MLCLVPWAAQAGPVAYGETFVRLGASWPDAGPVPPAAPAAPPADQAVARFRQRVSALEQAGGPYAGDLAEPLADLGRLHGQNGDHGQAQLLYQRALHLVRVNEGLYSERQLPILQELLASYRSSGDLEALDERYEYYFRLYGSGQAPYTAVRLRAALEYLRWQREALRLGLDKNDRRRLLRLLELNGQLLEGVATGAALAGNWYRDLVRSQLLNLYLVEERVEPPVETIGLAPPLPMVTADWQPEDMDQKRLENIRRGSLAAGRALLAGLLERVAVQEAAERAAVYLALGDWNQWHGREREAQAAYTEAESLLRGAGLEDLLQQWLSRAVELPDNGAFWQPQPLPGGEARVVVQATYDVSARGRARNIETSTVAPRSKALASRLRRWLSQTRFRPRFADGRAVADTGLLREYELID